MLARSTASVDRPFIGRSTAVVFGLMVALIASLVIGVTAARAGDEAQVAEQSSETAQSATATAAPATAEATTAPAEPATPAEPAPVPADTEVPETEDSSEPPAAEAPVEVPAEQPPATTTKPTQPEPAEPTDPEPAEPTDPEPTEPAPVEPSASATAQNQSQTWQAIFQVQQGCHSHCQGTSQSQTANQVAETIQSAAAIGGGTGSPSSATAVNQSTTGQFIWQVQLGCVAFCYGTSQSQTATQWAQTTQNATALSDGDAQAHNVGAVMQQVWQLQFGCEVECYGNSQSQSSTQGQSTSQSATATSETWAPSYPTDAQSLLPAWLVALAENLGITIQTSWQYQEASCLEHCVGDSQAQDAAQDALTSQEARAVAGVPPEEPQAPVTQTPPAEQSAPAVATTAGASSGSARVPSLIERVTATWRRVSGDGTSGSSVRGRSSVTSSSSPGGSATTETRVQSSTRIEARSSAAHTNTNTNTNTSTSASAKVTTSDSSSVQGQPLSSLADSGSNEGGTAWLLISLLIGTLMVLGTAFLRKVRTGRVVS